MSFGHHIQASRVTLDGASRDLRLLLHSTCVTLIESTDLDVKAACARRSWAIARGLEAIQIRVARLPELASLANVDSTPDDVLPLTEPAADDDLGVQNSDAPDDIDAPVDESYAALMTRLAGHRAAAFAISDVETGDTIKEVMDLLDVLASDIEPNASIPHLIDTDPAPFGAPVHPGRPEHLEIVDVNYRAQSIAAQLHDFAFRIELCATEVCAAMIAATPTAPVQLHIDLARQVRDEMRHFELFIDQIRRRGHSVDDFPIRFEIWDKFKVGRNIAEWLVIEQRLGEGSALDTAKIVHDRLIAAGEFDAAAVFEFVTSDEVQHVKAGNYWLANIVGDEEAVELLEAQVLALLDQAGLTHVPKPFTEEELRLAANFSTAEIERTQSRSSSVA